MRLSALTACAALLAVLPLSAQNFATHSCPSDEDHGGMIAHWLGGDPSDVPALCCPLTPPGRAVNPKTNSSPTQRPIAASHSEVQPSYQAFASRPRSSNH